MAAVVDPKLEIDEYLTLARYMGVSIEHILETHNHADHVSGHGRLGRRDRRDDPRPPRARRRTTTTSRSTTAGSSQLGDRVRARAAHSRPPARAHGVRADRHGARRGAVGGADRRHPVRGRHRAARPRRRQGGGSTRRSSARCTSSCCRSATASRSGPGHLGGSLCGGPGDGHEGLLHDRLRAPPQRAAARGRRGPLRRARDALARAPAAELPGRRRHQPRPAAERGRGGAPAHSAPGRAEAAPPGRSWWTCAPRSSSTRRTSRTRCRSPRCRRGSARSCRGSPSASRRSCSSAATTRTASAPRSSPAAVGITRSAATWPAA